MKSKIIVVGSLGVLLALLGGSGCERATEKATVVKSRTASAANVTTVEVRNLNGKVVVQGFLSLRPVIKVTATKWAMAPKQETAKKEVRKVKLRVLRVSATVARLVIEHPKGSRSRKYGADLRVLVPTTMGVNIDTKNGRIKVLGVRGRVVARTANGRIELRGLAAHVQAQTKNGRIVASGAIPSFDLRSSNGEIRLYLRKHSRLSAASSATTKNGSIRLSMPDRFHAKFAAKTSNGSLTVPFPKLSKTRSKVTGTLGKGGPLLALSTANGSIEVIAKPYIRTFAKPLRRPLVGGDSASGGRRKHKHGHGHTHGPGHRHGVRPGAMRPPPPKGAMSTPRRRPPARPRPR